MKTNFIFSILPGVTLAIGVFIVAKCVIYLIELALGLERSPISLIMVAILLGMILRNVISLPFFFESGIKMCITKLLRIGIILMGIRLSIFMIAQIGTLSIFIVIFSICSGLVIAFLIGRALALPPRLRTLIAVGTTICGASAIVATGSLIKAKEEEVTYAVGTITVFGIIAMFLYPYLTHLLLLLPYIHSGILMGVGIHETAQVVGAGLIYDQLWMREGFSGADVALLTKLVRNIFMVMVIPLAAYVYNKWEKKKGIKILNLFPFFILGFIAFSLIRSIGDYLFFNEEGWREICGFVERLGEYLLALAMAGVGLSTNFRKLLHLGIRPLLCGFFSAFSLGLISFTFIILLL